MADKIVKIVLLDELTNEIIEGVIPEDETRAIYHLLPDGITKVLLSTFLNNIDQEPDVMAGSDLSSATKIKSFIEILP